MGKALLAIGALILAGLALLLIAGEPVVDSAAILSPAGSVEAAAEAREVAKPRTGVSTEEETGQARVEEAPLAQRQALGAPLRWIRVEDKHGRAFDRFYGAVQWLRGSEKLRVDLDGRVALERMPAASERLAAWRRGEDVEGLGLEVQGSRMVGSASRPAASWRVTGETLVVRAERQVELAFALVGSQGQVLGDSKAKLAAHQPSSDAVESFRVEDGRATFRVRESELPVAFVLEVAGFRPVVVEVPDVVVENNAEVDLGDVRLEPLEDAFSGRLWLGGSTPLAYAKVVLIGSEGQAYGATTNAQGAFHVEGMKGATGKLMLDEALLGDCAALPVELTRGEPVDVDLGLARWDYELTAESAEQLHRVSVTARLTGAKLVEVKTVGRRFTLFVQAGRAHEVFVNTTTAWKASLGALASAPGAGAGTAHFRRLEVQPLRDGLVRLVTPVEAPLDYKLVSLSGHMRLDQGDTRRWALGSMPPEQAGDISVPAGHWRVEFEGRALPTGARFVPTDAAIEFEVRAGLVTEVHVPLEPAGQIAFEVDVEDAARLWGLLWREPFGLESLPVPIVAEVWRSDPGGPALVAAFDQSAVAYGQASVTLPPGMYTVRSLLSADTFMNKRSGLPRSLDGEVRAALGLPLTDEREHREDIVVVPLDEEIELGAGEVRRFVLATE